MRLIDAESLEEEFNKQANARLIGDDDFMEGVKNGYRFALRHLKYAPTVEERQHGEWIPCSERLPEENGRFLAFLPDRNGTFMCADFLKGQWYPDDYECTSDRVIAWMPLPEPYKKEGEA